MKSHRRHAPDINDDKSRDRKAVDRRSHPKGKKQRPDELNAAFKNFMYWLNQWESSKGREARCIHKAQDHTFRDANGQVFGVCYHGEWCKEFLIEAQAEYERLCNAAAKDGVI